MRLLLTRPLDDVTDLAEQLRAMGHEPVVHPFLNIKYDGQDAVRLKEFTVKQVQGLVFTSANGVRAFCQFDKRRSFPVFTVGDATARTASEAGFKNVRSAAGDVTSLAQHIAQYCQSEKGKLLHVAGSHVAGDLAGLLAKDGFDLVRLALYRSEKVVQLSDEVVAEIKEGRIEGVLLYSPRTAASFVELIKAQRLEKYTKSIVGYGLSAAVASKLEAMDLKAVQTAPTPDQEALLSLLGTVKEEAMTTDKKNETSKSDPKVIEGKAEEVKVTGAVKKDADKKDETKDAKKEPVKSSATPVSGDKKKDSASKADDKKTGPAVKVEDKTKKDDKAKDAPKAAAPTKPAKKKGSLKGKLMAATVLIVVGGAAGAYVTQDIWIPKVKAEIAKALKIETAEAPVADSRVDDLLARVEKLEARPVADPSSSSSVEVPEPVDIQPLLDRIASLEETLTALKTEVSAIEMAGGDEDKLAEFKALAERLEGIKMPEPAPVSAPVDLSGLEGQAAELETTVSALSERLAAMEAAGQVARSTADNAQALVAALSSLRDLLRTSAPYANELATFKQLSGEDTVLSEAATSLDGHASSGLASRSALTASFETTANDIVRAIAIPEGEGWMEETFRNITSLVSIRRAPGHMEGEGAMGMVARAEHNVRAGDFPGAIAELEGLEGLPREAAQDWIDTAKARLGADKALSDMQNHILSLIAGAGGQG